MRHPARLLSIGAALLLASTLTLDRGKPVVGAPAHAQLAGACGYLSDGVQAAYKYCSENNLSFSQCASDLKNKGVEAMKEAWNTIKGVFQWLKGLPATVGGWIETLKGYIESVSPKKALAFVEEKAKEVAQWASDLAAKAVGAIASNPKVKRVKSALGGVKSAFAEVSGWHPIDSAKRIYNAFIELKSSLVAAAGEVADLASQAMAKLNEIKNQIKSQVAAQIDAVKKKISDKVGVEVEAFKKSAKAEALNLAKQVAGSIIKKVMSSSGGAKTERSITAQLASAIAEKMKPAVRRGVDAVAKLAQTAISAAFGGASVTVETVCASVATAVGAATAGIGLAVAPVCSCVAGVALSTFKNWLVDYTTGKVIQPLVQKALEKIVEPVASELLKSYEGDLKTWLSGLASKGAAAIKSKINGVSEMLRNALPPAVFELASAGADKALESFGASAPKCVGIGFFKGIDCLRKAAADALKAGGSEIVSQLIHKLIDGPAAAIKARYAKVKSGLVKALSDLGVPLAADIVNALESTGKDVAINFAKNAVGCAGKLVGSSPLKTRVKAVISCLATAAKDALKGGGDALVRAAVKMLADNAARGAKALGGALSNAVSKLAGDAATVIPQEVRAAVREAAQKGLDDGAKKFASELNKRCVSLQRKSGQTFGAYLKAMGGCVASAASAALKAGGVAAVQSAIASALKSVAAGAKGVSHKFESFLGKFRDKAPGLVAGLTEALRSGTKEGVAKFKQLSAGCPKRFSAFTKAAVSAVVSCVKTAATSAFKAAGLAAVQSAIASALKSVAAGAKGVSHKFESLLGKFRDKAPGLISGLTEALRSGTKEGVAKFKQLSAGCPKRFSAFTKAAVSAVVSCVKTAATSAFKAAGLAAVQSAIASALKSVAAGAKGVSHKFESLLGKFRDKAPGLISGLTEALRSGTKEGVAKFKQLSAGCPKRFSAFTKAAVSAVVSCVKTAATSAFKAAGLAAVQSAIASALKSVVAGAKGVSHKFESLLGKFRDKAPGLISGLTEALRSGTKEGVAKFKQLSAGCPKRFSAFTKAAVSAVVSCVKTAATSAFKAAGVAAVQSALRQLVSALAKGSRSAVQSAVSAINKGLRAVGVSISAQPLADAAAKKIAGLQSAANACVSGFKALTKSAASKLASCLGKVAGMKSKCATGKEVVAGKCVTKCKTGQKRDAKGVCRAAKATKKDKKKATTKKATTKKATTKKATTKKATTKKATTKKATTKKATTKKATTKKATTKKATTKKATTKKATTKKATTKKATTKKSTTKKATTKKSTTKKSTTKKSSSSSSTKKKSSKKKKSSEG